MKNLSERKSHLNQKRLMTSISGAFFALFITLTLTTITGIWSHVLNFDLPNLLWIIVLTSITFFPKDSNIKIVSIIFIILSYLSIIAVFVFFKVKISIHFFKQFLMPTTVFILNFALTNFIRKKSKDA
jgi:hypothetical protein